MSDPITTFFDAWQLESGENRLKKLEQAVTVNISYNDPRTSNTINGIHALNDYISLFSANAPGWSARVIAIDTVASMSRATVAFGGKGPDGKEMVQHGQYFIEMDNDLIVQMTGFTGTGT